MTREPDQEFSPERRRFLNVLLGSGFFLWLGSVLYPVTRYLVPPASVTSDVTSVRVGKVDELLPGQYRIFRFGRKPGILFRMRDGSLHALSARCTHLDCTVQFDGEREQIWCACHNGIYDITGRNVSGPPPRPLDQYEVVVKGEDVYVRKGGTA